MMVIIIRVSNLVVIHNCCYIHKNFHNFRGKVSICIVFHDFSKYIVPNVVQQKNHQIICKNFQRGEMKKINTILDKIGNSLMFMT